MQWASLLAQVKNILQTKTPPAVWEIWVPPLDWDDPLEKGKELEVGGASRDSTGLGALEEGLISS